MITGRGATPRTSTCRDAARGDGPLAEAHAAITSIDTSAAKERSGVVAVLTGEDMAGDFAGPLPMVWAPPGVEIKTPEHWPLKRGEVKHVGDPVAVVVATSCTRRSTPPRT